MTTDRYENPRIEEQYRTPSGKLIGTYDFESGEFIIRARNRETRIRVPPGGLWVIFLLGGDGKIEELYIPFSPIPTQTRPK
jgi:hypothetical protein